MAVRSVPILGGGPLGAGTIGQFIRGVRRAAETPEAAGIGGYVVARARRASILIAEERERTARDLEAAEREAAELAARAAVQADEGAELAQAQQIRLQSERERLQALTQALALELTAAYEAERAQALAAMEDDVAFMLAVVSVH